jgi:hypothetical protein
VKSWSNLAPGSVVPSIAKWRIPESSSHPNFDFNDVTGKNIVYYHASTKEFLVKIPIDIGLDSNGQNWSTASTPTLTADIEVRVLKPTNSQSL